MNQSNRSLDDLHKHMAALIILLSMIISVLGYVVLMDHKEEIRKAVKIVVDTFI